MFLFHNTLIHTSKRVLAWGSFLHLIGAGGPTWPDPDVDGRVASSRPDSFAGRQRRSLPNEPGGRDALLAMVRERRSAARRRIFNKLKEHIGLITIGLVQGKKILSMIIYHGIVVWTLKILYGTATSMHE
jgi:hypothetical protein